jgi:hypothetical protein
MSRPSINTSATDGSIPERVIAAPAVAFKQRVIKHTVLQVVGVVTAALADAGPYVGVGPSCKRRSQCYGYVDEFGRVYGCMKVGLPRLSRVLPQ